MAKCSVVRVVEQRNVVNGTLAFNAMQYCNDNFQTTSSFSLMYMKIFVIVTSQSIGIVADD